MAHAILAALEQISKEVATLLTPENIRETCQAVGHHWRDRLLDPITTIHLFILQILHCNTACSHLPRITGRYFTVSAYCQARAHLPLVLLEKLLARIGETVRPFTEIRYQYLIDHRLHLSLSVTHCPQRSAAGEFSAYSLFHSWSGPRRVLHLSADC